MSQTQSESRRLYPIPCRQSGTDSYSERDDNIDRSLRYWIDWTEKIEITGTSWKKRQKHSWEQRTSRKDDVAAYKRTKKKSMLSWKRQNITHCDRVFWNKKGDVSNVSYFCSDVHRSREKGQWVSFLFPKRWLSDPPFSFESEQISIRRCRSKIMDRICDLFDKLRKLQNCNFIF